MSGDVQPRRRKDKKRKKDDGTEQTFAQPLNISSATVNDDVNIHIHKEEGTGGGVCAKVVFFLLFSALAVLVGLIITEHRGLTDLESVEQESKFSQLFEGWIDSSPNHDDQDHSINGLEDELIEQESEETHDQDEEENSELEASEEVAELDDNEEDGDDEEVTEEVQNEEDEDVDQSDQSEEQLEESEQNIDSEEAENASELQDDDDDDDEEDEQIDEDTSRYVEKSEEEENNDDEDTSKNEDDDDDKTDHAEDDENFPKELDDEQDEETLEQEDQQDEEELAEKSSENVEEMTNEPMKSGIDETPSYTSSVKVSDNNEPVESDSDPQSDTDAYEYENITSKEDSRIKDDIDEAQATVRNNATFAIKLFDILLQQFPSSPRCLYGKAQAFDLLAEQQRSNKFLQKAIDLYLKVLNLKDVPDALFEAAADRCINRMRFIGSYNRAVDVHFKLTERFPTVSKHKNQLVITYLIMNRVAKARKVLEDLLLQQPDDGLALVHYGFILKTADNKLNESVDYLRRGIASKAEGVVDGRFYFHLGDALSRLGRQDEAMQIYEEGVSYNLFLSKYQRSLYNVQRLKGQPWWEQKETKYEALFVTLEKNWQQIRDEGLAALNKKNTFQDEAENLKHTGDWKQLELFARGQKNVENCKKCPMTCKIIENIPEARTCRRGQTKFSVMHPGTHVWPHCGPTNCRLRAHLGLKVPEHTYIRVAEETRSWKEGKVFIFDDSFEHEVWHNGTTFRLVLIMDVWHPELTLQERRGLSPI